MAGEGRTSMEYTPTWVVAAVCSVIVIISFALERTLHYLGKLLKKKNQKPLFEALLKVKEELMLMGFISLLLTVFQGAIGRLCLPIHLTKRMLPCKFHEEQVEGSNHFQTAFISGIFGNTRRLLSEGSETDHCAKQGKVPLMSSSAIHELHIFIFVLAISHVLFCLITILLGGAKIRNWKHWEDSLSKENLNTDQADAQFTHVQEHSFIKTRYQGIGKGSKILGWLHSFFKQFYGSVTKADYGTLRFGFIMKHCKGNPRFNFYNYMVRALEADFKRVVGISWYLWIFVVIFLFLNVAGWHAYFWISFIPLILLLAVGAKLEHVISQLAHEVAEKHIAIEGNLVVKPSDEHFWFNRPRIVLHLIHFILFQNAFEIAVFFWIWTSFKYDSCMMGETRFIIPRLVIGVIVQVVCSYSTLPLYAIVTQMGSSFSKAIFDENIQEGLVQWAQKIKKRTGKRVNNGRESPNDKAHAGDSAGIQMPSLEKKESEIEKA